MKYKLQIEKLKQLKMDGNLSMANQLENNEPMNITPEQLRALIADNLKDNNHKQHILEQFEFMKNGMDFFETELRRYYGYYDRQEKEAKECYLRIGKLERMLHEHQEFSQWLEEQMDNMTTEKVHNFIPNLYNKTYKLNHD